MLSLVTFLSVVRGNGNYIGELHFRNLVEMLLFWVPSRLSLLKDVEDVDTMGGSQYEEQL